MTIVSEQWSTTREGQNLVLCHFDEGGEIIYYISKVQKMITCLNMAGDERGLFIFLDQAEIKVCNMLYVEDDKRYKHTLANLWRKKSHARLDTSFYTPWVMAQRMMMCKDGGNIYYTAFE